MFPLDFILARAQTAWDAAAQYFEDPMVIFAFAAVLIFLSLAMVHRRH